MTKSKDINKDKITKQEEREVFMFFSKQSSSQFGHNIAYVKDKKSGRRKKIRYTATSSDKSASEYKWPDKKLIWSGKNSDFEFVGIENNRSVYDFI